MLWFSYSMPFEDIQRVPFLCFATRGVRRVNTATVIENEYLVINAENVVHLLFYSTSTVFNATLWFQQ